MTMAMNVIPAETLFLQLSSRCEREYKEIHTQFGSLDGSTFRTDRV